MTVGASCLRVYDFCAPLSPAGFEGRNSAAALAALTRIPLSSGLTHRRSAASDVVVKALAT